MNFQIFGQNEEQGKMTLTMVEKGEDYKVTYNGEIIIKEKDDNDNFIEGQVLVTSNAKDGTGEITIKQSNGKTIKGKIQLWKEGVYTQEKPAEIKQVDNYDFSEFEKDNRGSKVKYKDRTVGDIESEFESETEVKYKDKGFWQKVKGFFGLDKA